MKMKNSIIMALMAMAVTTAAPRKRKQSSCLHGSTTSNCLAMA